MVARMLLGNHKGVHQVSLATTPLTPVVKEPMDGRPDPLTHNAIWHTYSQWHLPLLETELKKDKSSHTLTLMQDAGVDVWWLQLLLTTKIIATRTSMNPASHAFHCTAVWALPHSFHYPKTLYAMCENIVRWATALSFNPKKLGHLPFL